MHLLKTNRRSFFHSMKTSRLQAVPVGETSLVLKQVTRQGIDRTELPPDVVEFRLGIEFLLDPTIPFET